MNRPRSTANTGTAWCLPRLQAIERCSSDGSLCEYLAWLVILPNRTGVTGRLGKTARDITLWPNVEEALAAFGHGAVIDDSPARHMPTDRAATHTEQSGS